jgi:hypothetical protein
MGKTVVILNEMCCGFSQSLQESARLVPRLHHEHFLPNHPQCFGEKPEVKQPVGRSIWEYNSKMDLKDIG